MKKGGDNLFEKIIPTPRNVLKKTDEEISKWKEKNWMPLCYQKISDEIVHREDYSIFRFEIQSACFPVYGILKAADRVFSGVKSVILSLSEIDNESSLYRKDLAKGYIQCFSSLPDLPIRDTDNGPAYPIDISEDFLADLSKEADLSDALRLIGLDFSELT